MLAGKSKKEDGVKEDKRKRDSSAQLPKSSRPSAGGKPQQPTAPQQAPPGQPQQGTFVAHKEIKLTLLNKVRPWHCWWQLREPSPRGYPTSRGRGAVAGHSPLVLLLSGGDEAQWQVLGDESVREWWLLAPALLCVAGPM